MRSCANRDRAWVCNDDIVVTRESDMPRWVRVINIFLRGVIDGLAGRDVLVIGF